MFPTLGKILKGGIEVKKGGWTSQIKMMMKAKQIDPEEYLPVVRTLADILEQRDAVYKEYKAEGSRPVVEYTNKAGATNCTKNPLLILWDELNTTALTYWRDLGLTPSAYKKITGDKPTGNDAASSLVAALQSLEKN